MKLSFLIPFLAIALTSDRWLVADDTESTMKEVTESPAYHAEWGPDRGFEPGQTVPDIPLIDLDGNEVRFDAFLGKRYIIYGWASW
ncbi:MAG: hypothetical protein AAGA96_17345 [Verrucomicrobiota bacterium]